MEFLILSHFTKPSDFQKFVSLTNVKVQESLFFKDFDTLFFFENLVYRNHSINQLESGILIHGENEGFWTEWYTNGVKFTEGSYENGKKEGFWITWYNMGEKGSEGSYYLGYEDGLWTYWYRNGKMESRGMVHMSDRYGIWTKWYENGEKAYEYFYRRGE